MSAPPDIRKERECVAHRAPEIISLNNAGSLHWPVAIAANCRQLSESRANLRYLNIKLRVLLLSS